MKRTRLTIGSILVAGLGLAPAAFSQRSDAKTALSFNTTAGSSEHRPDTLAADRNSPPFWISASAATSANGELNYDAFDPGLRETVRSQAIPITHSAANTSAVEPCGQFTVSFNEGAAKAMTTWRDALANASSVVKGTITAVTPGFLSTAPATMLTIRVTEALRADAALRSTDELFVPYMGADFKIGSSRFCNAGLSRNGGSFLPAVNDDVLMFVFDAPREYYLPARDENLFFGRNDSLYTPTIFSADTTLPERRSFKALIARVRTETRSLMRTAMATT